MCLPNSPKKSLKIISLFVVKEARSRICQRGKHTSRSCCKSIFKIRVSLHEFGYIFSGEGWEIKVFILWKISYWNTRQTLVYFGISANLNKDCY